MIQLLILGNTILAKGPFIDTTDEIKNVDSMEPTWSKSVISGWQIVDVEIPDGFVPHLYTWDGLTVQLKVISSEKLAELRIVLAAEIEDAVMAVYARPVALAREYELREADAVAFKASDYLDEAGSVLAGFALAKGITNREATDAVLAQSVAYRSAERTLADLRMKKYEVLRATTESTARSVHATTMATIKAIAAAIA